MMNIELAFTWLNIKVYNMMAVKWTFYVIKKVYLILNRVILGKIQKKLKNFKKLAFINVLYCLTKPNIYLLLFVKTGINEGLYFKPGVLTKRAPRSSPAVFERPSEVSRQII